MSREVSARRVYAPVAPLDSLSRLMRHGAGPGRTRADHLDLAAQALAALARARQARDLSDLIGTDALSVTDRRYLELEDAFSRELVDQRSDETRGLDDTLERLWRALSRLPRGEPLMLPAELVAARYGRG